MRDVGDELLPPQSTSFMLLPCPLEPGYFSINETAADARMKWEALAATSKSFLLGEGTHGLAFVEKIQCSILCWLRSTRLSLKLVLVGEISVVI